MDLGLDNDADEVSAFPGARWPVHATALDAVPLLDMKLCGSGQRSGEERELKPPK